MTGFHTFLYLKRIATIPLLGLLLFNWIGYRAVALMVLSHIDSQVEADFDAGDYGESPLVSFHIQMPQLPYYTPSGKFERVNGSVRINGVEYRFVQRRWHNDSLEILCAPNNAAMGLQADCNAYFNGSTDIADHSVDARHHPHKATLRVNEPSDYEVPSETLLSVFSTGNAKRGPNPDCDVNSCVAPVDDPPPDLLTA